MAKRILVVEDDEFLGETLIEWLKDAGYQASLAPTGMEAINLLSKEDFEILLTDINLSSIQGDHIVEWFDRAQKKTEKVIIMSGQSARLKEMQFKNFKNFEPAFITKPFQISDLIGVIEKTG